MKLSKIKNTIGVIALSTLICGQAAAETVEESDITTFEDGTPAVAAEVNANFQALITAINDNATRLAAIEASAGSSVAGKTFRLNQIGILLRGDGNGAATAANLSQTYLVTFDSDMSFSFVGEESEGELQTTTGVFGSVVESEAVDVSGSYSQSSSNVTVDFGGGETVTFTVSADGNVLLLGEFKFEEDEGFQRSETSYIVGVAIE
jgi:hypothetical protein